MDLPSQIESINASQSSFTIALTSQQIGVLQSLLPKGFSLIKNQEISKKTSSSLSNKKIHLNDGNSRKIEKKTNNPLNTSQNDDKNSNSNLSIPSLQNTANANRSLRQKSSKINYDRKYAEMETSPITSSMKNLKVSNENLRKVYKILLILKKNINAEPFLKPVDPIALNIPDYFTIIKEPMDLGTIEKNMMNNSYKTHSEFASDVRKIWNNSFLYNAKGSVVYHMTCEMSNLFEKLYKDVEKKASHDNINELQKKIDQLSKELNTLYSGGPSKGSKQSSSLKSNNYSFKSGDKNNANHINMDKPMTLNEKKNLGQNIRKLPPEYLRGVWEIVCEGTNLAQDKEELEFDIETLPVRKVRELERYVKTKLKIVAKANIRKTKKNEGKKEDFNEIGGKIKENSGNGSDLNKFEVKSNESLGKIGENEINYNEGLNNSTNDKNLEAGQEQEVNKSSDSSFITDSSEDSGQESLEGVM